MPPDAPEGHASRHVWTSGNLNPPSCDPQLVEDPGSPTYYPREAAIPVPQARAAVEEFCRERTGARPECIPWLLLNQSV
ncbi:Imm1 family immunity protein [Streptomyces pilosus]|uniref:Imm1 family immunity protein n=1 Tax=Streptomyces pilosus TaxID=28893 RepID=UPI0036271A33